MSTKEAQDRARKAHRARQLAEGWRQKAFFLAPDTIARLARLSASGKTSEAATVAHALAKLEEAQVLEVGASKALANRQVLDVDAEHRLPGPVKPSSRKPMASKLDTSSVPVHPGLRGNK